jgi:hypothetical protein
MDNKPTTRESGNRLIGLSSYALGILLVGVLGLCIYDDGFKDVGSLGLIAVIASICFAVGYTTSRKRLS